MNRPLENAPNAESDEPLDYEPADEGSAEKLRKRQEKAQRPLQKTMPRAQDPALQQKPQRLGTVGAIELLFTTHTNLGVIESDAWVVPSDPKGVPGHFGEALVARLPGDLGASLRSRFGKIDALIPVKPLVFTIEPRNEDGAQRDTRFIFATATDDQGAATTAAAITAMHAACAWADSLGVALLALPLVGCGWSGLDPVAVGVGFVRRLKRSPIRDLARIVVPGLPPHVVAAMKAAIEEPDDEPLRDVLAQPMANDAASGPDRLGIEPEAYAIAEAIASKAMEPPLVVGILGGWGAGKSFVLHLIEQRLRQIRGHSLLRDDAKGGHPFAFIGHPYVIRFDAWTYAKSNLWASLMQTVFFELNRQLSLEKAVRDRAQALQSAAKPGAAPIDEATLWRALVDLSDRQRGELLDTPAGQEALAILAQIDAGKNDVGMLWKRLEQIKADDVKALRESEELLAAKKAELEKARRELEAAVDAELEVKARKDAWSPLAERMRKFVGAAFENELEKKGVKPEELPELRSLFEKKSWTEMFGLGFNVQTAALLAFAALGALLPQLLANSWVANAMSALAAAAGTIATAGRAIQNARTSFEKQRADYEASLAETRAKRAKEREKLIEERLHEDEKQHAQLRKQRAEQGKASQQPGKEAEAAERATGAHSVSALEADVRKLEADVEMHRQRVGMTARYPSLVDFVRGRAESEEYAGQLGLLHRVQRDLEELTEGLMPSANDSETQRALKAELFPRGAPRIVLVVDDLDRCPPDRVVEVLEAAQLLVKTRLFVVVLAMDVRYVTRALEKVYRGVLKRHGDPSGLDYLEKIVQVPYRVRPVDAGKLGEFLRANAAVRADAPVPPAGTPAPQAAGDAASRANLVAPGGKGAGSRGAPTPADAVQGGAASGSAVKVPRVELPTEILELSKDEFEALTIACKTSDLTPRAIKRLANVLKLMKIVWHRRGEQEGPDRSVKQTLLSLLAVSARYPEVMRPFLSCHERGLARGGAPATMKVLLDQAYKQTLARERLASSIRSDIERVQELLGDATLFPADGWRTLTKCEDARLVSTFSFLGEDMAPIAAVTPRPTA